LRVLEDARFAAVLRVPVDLRPPVDLRAPVERGRLELADPLEEALSSSVHLPDRTRCAASATASAISEPSFDALPTTALAACCALSAASRPASRIFRRAAGLALIAAAAAAKPAASISRLIAALAILSNVSLPPPFVLLDLAIANLLRLLSPKTNQTRNGSVTPSNRVAAFPKFSIGQIR
jgi:hypothetical protein